MSISDLGAIVGTATYTGTATTTGSHGVLLLPVTVTGVSFDGDKYWQLESDDTTVQYSAPQWSGTKGDPTASQNGEYNYAVAYTRNTIPKIGATFKIPGASNWTNLKFKATGPDGISIPATAGTVGTDGMTVTMPKWGPQVANRMSTDHCPLGDAALDKLAHRLTQEKSPSNRADYASAIGAYGKRAQQYVPQLRSALANETDAVTKQNLQSALARTQ